MNHTTRKNLVTSQSCSWVSCCFLAAQNCSTTLDSCAIPGDRTAMWTIDQFFAELAQPSQHDLIVLEIVNFFGTQRVLCPTFKTLMSICKWNSFRVRLPQVCKVCVKKWRDQCWVFTLRCNSTLVATPAAQLKRYPPPGWVQLELASYYHRVHYVYPSSYIGTLRVPPNFFHHYTSRKTRSNYIDGCIYIYV